MNNKKTMVLIPLSGGKDSQAALLWAIDKYGLENCQTAFCDVKWEAPETYRHVEYLVKKTGVKHNVLKSTKYDGMVDLAKKKGRFPSTKARFCTQELKIKPMIDFILSQEKNILVIDGVRADESESRSKKKPECRYFKYYFEPYLTNEMIVNKFNIKAPVTYKQKIQFETAKNRLDIGKNDPKYFAYRKKEVLEWCKKYADDLIRPFFYATGDDVISYSLNKGYEINPLYFQGFSRVGCMPCIMANSGEIKQIVLNKPEVIDKIKAAELEANSSFFAPDKTPKKYRTKEKNGKIFSGIDDIVKYTKDKNNNASLFQDDKDFNRCKSFYNICE